MRLLLIAYAFPPMQDAQSLRWYYLSNALAGLGANIDVLTVSHPEELSWGIHKNINIFRTYAGVIETVALKAKKELGVEDIENREVRNSKKFKVMKSMYWAVRNLSNSILPGDVRTEWLPFALNFIRKQNLKSYDCIITSHEPWVTSLIGLNLKKWKKSIRWLADFGDPYVAPYTPKHKVWFENRLEKAIYKNADILTFTNSHAVEHVRKKYPSLSGKRMMTIEQGFCSKVFDILSEPKEKNEVFTMIYAGTFYEKFRNPENLIKALKGLDFDFKFLLAGRNERFCDDFKVLGDKFEFLGFVDHFRVLELLKESDALVYLSNEDPVQVPGKFFEYLGAGSPIISILYDDRDVTKELTKELECGISCMNDPEEIEDAIRLLYDNWQNNENEYKVDQDAIYKYSWECKAQMIYNEISDA